MPINRNIPLVKYKKVGFYLLQIKQRKAFLNNSAVFEAEKLN